MNKYISVSIFNESLFSIFFFQRNSEQTKANKASYQLKYPSGKTLEVEKCSIETLTKN